MGAWLVWVKAFDGVTLRDDGDPTEIDGAVSFGLDKKFPNYEIFWRRHVVPATNRPANIHHRANVDRTVADLSMVSHGIFCDLVTAERNLGRVMANDYGDSRYHTCLQTLKSGG